MVSYLYLILSFESLFLGTISVISVMGICSVLSSLTFISSVFTSTINHFPFTSIKIIFHFPLS